MNLNQKKKIYIIGSNPYNFLDITLESFNKIKECDCVIISKSFKQKFVNILKKIVNDMFLKKIFLHQKD